MSLNIYPVQLFTKRGWFSPGVHLIGPALFTLVLLLMLAIGVTCLVNATGWINKPFAGFLFYEFPGVGSFGDYRWAGFQAGVHYRDVIVEIDDHKIYSGKDIQKIV